MIELDEIDKAILSSLQANAKVNIKELADALNMTKTPIYERIKRLEKLGVIKQYVTILDRRLLESSMVVFCSVSLESQKLENIEEFSEAIEKIPEVLECY